MYSTTAYFEQDSHSDALVKAGYDLGNLEVPEPLETWSLADFDDIVRGQLS